MAVKVLVKSQDQKQALCIIYFCDHLTNHEVLSFYIFYQHILNCLRTITLVCGIFSQDHYLLQRCHKGACANIIFALARLCGVLDGYVRKSPPPLHPHTGLTYRPRPYLSRPCLGRFATLWPSLATAPAYNVTDDSPVHSHSRFTRSPWLTTRRITCPSAPAYNATAGSSVYAASDVTIVFTVRLSRPGLYRHTELHLSG